MRNRENADLPATVQLAAETRLQKLIARDGSVEKNREFAQWAQARLRMQGAMYRHPGYDPLS